MKNNQLHLGDCQSPLKVLAQHGVLGVLGVVALQEWRKLVGGK